MGINIYDELILLMDITTLFILETFIDGDMNLYILNKIYARFRFWDIKRLSTPTKNFYK